MPHFQVVQPRFPHCANDLDLAAFHVRNRDKDLGFVEDLFFVHDPFDFPRHLFGGETEDVNLTGMRQGDEPFGGNLHLAREVLCLKKIHLNDIPWAQAVFGVFVHLGLFLQVLVDAHPGYPLQFLRHPKCLGRTIRLQFLDTAVVDPGRRLIR